MSEVILSALASDISVIDGMDRTMMVATEAACATAVMLPVWNVFKPDVTYRTLLGATSIDDQSAWLHLLTAPTNNVHR